MRTAVVVGCVLLLLLAMLALWTSGSATPTPTRTGERADGTPPTADRATSGASPPAAAPRALAPAESRWLDDLAPEPDPPVAAAADDPEALVVRGRLTVRQRPWLHPAGVEIRLTRHWLDTVLPTEAAAGDATPANREPVATTQSDGSFAFRVRPVAGALFFLIDRGGAWNDYQKVPRLPLLPGDLDLGDVFVDDRGSIAGRVVDPHGLPRAGATVRAVGETLGEVDAGLGELRAARTDGAELFAANGATALGPLPDWTARRDALLPFPAATTDRDGRFELRGLRPGEHDLIVRHPFGHGTLREVRAAPQLRTEVGDVCLQMARPVQWTFVDDDGKPWVGASIAFVHERLGFGGEPVRTDAHGTISTVVADAGDVRLVFTYPGGGPTIDLGASGRASWGAVTVPRVPPRTVSLADPAGVPLTDGRARFYVTGAQFRPIDRRLPDWMQPQQRLPGLHAGFGFGGTVVVATAPGHAPAIGAFGPGSSHLALTLLPLQRVTVSVRDRVDRPIAGATVRVQVHEHEALRFPGAQWERLADDRATVGRTDEQGRLTVPVWGTWFSFQASHPDYAPTAGPRFVPQPDQIVDLVLYERGGIVGTLTAQHRRAPAGLRVVARQRPAPGHPTDDSGFLAEHRAVVGDDGRFELRDLTAGVWELQPEFPAVPGVAGARASTGTFAAHQVLLDAGQVRHVTLDLSRTPLTVVQLAGVVRSNGAPVADAVVRVRTLPDAPPRLDERRRRLERALRHADRRGETSPRQHAPWLQQCTTDWFGDFEFGGLAPGREYEVRVDVPAAGRLQFLGRRVVRTPGTENEPPARLDLDLATGALDLCCTGDGQPLAGRMLRLREVVVDGGDGACFQVLTDALGRVLVEGLPAGAWTLEPMHGGEFLDPRLTVTANTTTAVSAVLAPPADVSRSWPPPAGSR